MPPNAAIRGPRRIGQIKGFRQGARHRTTAGVGVLDHGGRRWLKLTDTFYGGIRVENVDIGELFAMKLLGRAALT